MYHTWAWGRTSGLGGGLGASGLWPEGGSSFIIPRGGGDQEKVTNYFLIVWLIVWKQKSGYLL